MAEASSSSSDGIMIVVYFRFRGWRHVSHIDPHHVCIAKLRERNSQNYCVDSKQILFNDKDKQIHIMGCAPAAKSALRTLSWGRTGNFSNILVDRNHLTFSVCFLSAFAVMNK